jgi:hypothetical protein
MYLAGGVGKINPLENKKMNVTDLRIAFKMDTGDYPLWSKTHDGKDMYGTSWQRGYPRSIYGLWLEDKIGKTKYLRDKYFKVTSEMPTSDFFGQPYYWNRGWFRYHRNVVIYGDYCEWLETFILKFKPEIVRKIINV